MPSISVFGSKSSKKPSGHKSDAKTSAEKTPSGHRSDAKTSAEKTPSGHRSDAKNSSERIHKAYNNDLATFRTNYPQYDQSASLDILRKTEFSRMEKTEEVYVDYMGGCLWPQCLVATHSAILQAGVFGNTHSDSPSATRSDFHIAAARNAVLEYFDAPAEDYACIFTANATTALKIVGESFPFRPGSRLIIPADCHNSVNGIRRFAKDAGATVEYLETTRYGGFHEEDAMKAIKQQDSTSGNPASLFILTGQSNVTGLRPSTHILTAAKSHGYSTLIDAAALASSTRVSLSNLPSADAMAVSFYKMFGYPTGVGALIAKKEFLGKFERRWFSGGTVDFVQAPGGLTLHAKDLTARFEEGTLNYGALSAIAPGLDLLRTHMPSMSLRLPALHHYLHTALESLVYPGTDTHLVRVHTKLRHLPLRRSPSRLSIGSDTQDSSSGSENGSVDGVFSPRFEFAPMVSPRTDSFRMFLSNLSSVGLPTSPSTLSPPASRVGVEQPALNKSAEPGQGYVVSCTFYASDGTAIPLPAVSRLASASGISLRTGCVCNPGGAAALRGKHIQDKMEELSNFGEDVELKDIWNLFSGQSSTGVVRLSLGMVSNFEDVWRVVRWAQGLLDENKRGKDLERLAGSLKELATMTSNARSRFQVERGL